MKNWVKTRIPRESTTEDEARRALQCKRAEHIAKMVRSSCRRKVYS